MDSLDREIALPRQEGLTLTPLSLGGLFVMSNVKFIRTETGIAVFRDYITHGGGASLFGVALTDILDGGFIHALDLLPDHALIRVLGTTDTVHLPSDPDRRDRTVATIQNIISQANYPKPIIVERADPRPVW